MKIKIDIEVEVTEEPGVSENQKAAFIKQLALDQAAALANNYDYGITVKGTVASQPVDITKQDYEG